MKQVIRWTILGGLGLVVGAGPLAALPPGFRLGPAHEVAVSAGAFDPFVESHSLEIGGEVRFAPRHLGILPHVLPELLPTFGMVATGRGTLYAYGGLRAELKVGRRWTLSPSVGVGLFQKSDDFALGGPIELRSGFELAWSLPTGSRLGLTLYHLSNAGLYNRNPGSESLVFTYSVPLGRKQ